jgi:hypothetical protein
MALTGVTIGLAGLIRPPRARRRRRVEHRGGRAGDSPRVEPCGSAACSTGGRPSEEGPRCLAACRAEESRAAWRHGRGRSSAPLGGMAGGGVPRRLAAQPGKELRAAWRHGRARSSASLGGTVFRAAHSPTGPATATAIDVPAESGHPHVPSIRVPARSEVNRSLTFGWQLFYGWSMRPWESAPPVASAGGRTPRVAWTREHVRGRWLMKG